MESDMFTGSALLHGLEAYNPSFASFDSFT